MRAAGVFYLLCLGLGLAVTAQAVVCLLPHKVENAAAPDPHKESYKYGEVIRYECLRGHTLSGSSSRSCSDEGNFRPDPPTCIKVQCKTPSIKNAYRDGGGAPPYGYNAFVTYQCDRGYTLVGEASVTCGINSQWSPALPECRVGTLSTIVPPVRTLPTIVPPGNGGPHWSTSWWFITICVGLGVASASGVWWLCLRDREEKRRRKRCMPVDGPL